MTDGRRSVLEATAGMPERRLEPGEPLFALGQGEDHTVAVLVDGVLSVDLGATHLHDIDAPGTFLGEIGALLGIARTADVTARTPAVVRVVGDPETFFASHPDIGLELSRQLAGRIQRLTSYLGDIKAQYADSEGHLSMVDSVLGRIGSRPAVDIDPGSDRSPDY